MKVGKLDGIN